MAQNSTRKKAVQAPTESSNEAVQDTLERLAKLAESQLEMARLFINRVKNEIARRRLGEIMEVYPQCAAACETRQLLKYL